MNYLQKYLFLRGITARQIAKGTGLNYHSVQKNIKGVRSVRVVRDAIADYLHLPYTHVWGVAAPRHLRRLLEKAIEARGYQHGKAEQQRLHRQYLGESLTETKAVSNG